MSNFEQNTLDFLFSFRNRAYGAFDLRMHYARFIKRGAFIGYGSVVLFFGVWAMWAQRMPATVQPIKTLDSLKVLEVEMLPPPPDIDKPPPPVNEPPKAIKTVKFLAPEVKQDVLVKDPIPDQKTLAENVISDRNRAGESGNFSSQPLTVVEPLPPPPPPPPPPEPEPPPPAPAPEPPPPPEPIVAARMVRIVAPQYPPAARSAKIQAIVSVQVDIDVAGRASNPQITRRVLLRDGQETPTPSIGFGVEEAAVAAALRHQFRPARQGTKPIPSNIIIDLKFGVE